MASQSPIVASDQSSGGSGVGALQFKSTIVSLRKSLEGQENRNVQQTQEISALRGTVDALRTETATLSNGLTSISNLIQQDSALEKQQNAQEAERERRLLETKIRMGKESQLEQKITNSLARPVQALQRKVTNIFERIGGALTTLFFGWLTNQGIEALKAASEGNKKKLEEIKNTVLKGIGDVVKIFAVISKGFNLVIKSVTGLAGRIGGLVLKLATAPIKALTNVVRGAPLLTNIFGGPKTGGGVRGPNFIGGALNLYTAIMNWNNGEITDALMQGLLAAISFTPAGRLVSVVRAVLGVSVTADEIAEVFGSNIFGENPDILREANKVKETAEKEAKQTKKPASTSKTAAKVEPPATAQTPLMGGDKNKKDGVEANVSSGTIPESAEIKSTSDSTTTASSPKTSMLPETKKPDTASTPKTSMMPETKKPDTASTPTSTPQTSMMGKTTTAALPPPSPEMEKNFELAWKNKDRPFARGRIESAWNGMSVEQQQQAEAWARSKGYDWNEMKLTQKSPVVPAEVTAANMQPLSKSSQNVGELPEPKTSVIMAPAAQNQPQQSSASSASPSETNVPLISSSNPDNFYVLYSQLNYNVVV